ncbi:MAG: ATP-binding cassette domain-containing protein [Culicoidibacterales bacterium]
MYIRKIAHSYEKFTLDVNNITLKETGIIGLVGENGSGKTTFMSIFSQKMMANQTYEVEGNLREEEILFIPADLVLYDLLTVNEFLTLHLKYSNSSKGLKELLERLHLTDKSDTLIQDLSFGMKKKLTLAPLFSQEVKVVILDEPFNGIDVKFLLILKEDLKKRAQKCLIIISSHILDALIDMSGEIIFIKNGQISFHEEITDEKIIGEKIYAEIISS